MTAALPFSNTQSDEETSASMEKFLRTFLWALNHRCFGQDPSDQDYHSVWNHFADDFIGEPEYVATVDYKNAEQEPPPVMLREGAERVVILGQERLKDMFRVVTKANPDYQICGGQIDTLVYGKARWAVSYLAMETHGMPLGIVGPSLGVCEWKVVDGCWRIKTYKGMASIPTQ